jgi:undecaprenyl-diphosphatase
MEQLNYTLLLALRAPVHPAETMLGLAIFLAQYLIWLIPALIGVRWLYRPANRATLLIATVSAVLGLLIGQLISWLAPHPRPFMVGLAPALISHAPDPSFPSDHLTLWWSVSFALLADRGLRRRAVALALLGVPMAWARIYLGVHFPLDMVGALIVAACSAALAWRLSRCYLPKAYELAHAVHRHVFASLIRRGWVCA